MPQDLDTIRASCRADLPDRIAAALEDYHRFTTDPPPADAKGFAAWQAAAKAALAHVEVLVKLARWANGTDTADPQDDAPETGLAHLLAQARDALDGLEDDDEYGL